LLPVAFDAIPVHAMLLGWTSAARPETEKTRARTRIQDGGSL
jgi:hypothetical protein